MGLLAAGLTALTAGAVRAQDYTAPDPVFPLPLYHDRPELGGFYASGEFLFMRQTNPLKHQVIAFRGLVDFDGSVIADLNGTTFVPTGGGQRIIVPGNVVPGTFIGSGAVALSSDDAHGPQTYEPGFALTLGWRFRSGVAVEIQWWHLFEAKYAAVATLVPPNLQAGQNLEDTFLFSPVFNFPNDFAGPPQKIALGNPFAVYGIWNGASIMSEQFTQRFEQFDVTGRIPLYENDCDRCYGIIGPRLVWFWERFQWRTVSQDFNGQATQADVALYSNIVSNRLYGVHIGGGNEYRLGDTPIGTFSVSIDLQAAALLDVIKERAKYERADFAIAAQRARTEYKAVPELQGQINLWWYPIEGIEMRLGYDAMGFFNTVSSPYPVDFNYGRLNGGWRDNTFRFVDGLNAGIGFIF
jgi:hypothetical protein